LDNQDNQQLKADLMSRMLDKATDSILLHDLDGNVIYVNESTYKNRGYTKEEFMKINFQDINSSQSSNLIRSRMEDLMKKGTVVFESTDMCKDGSLIYVEVHAQIIESDDKKFVLSIERDITTRKEAEKKFLERNDQIEAIFSSMNDGIVIMDKNGEFFMINDAAIHLHGFEGKKDFLTRLPDYYELFELATLDRTIIPTDNWPAARAMRGEILKDFKVILTRKDTNQSWIVSYNSSAVYENEDELKFIVFNIRDITQSQKNEEEIRKLADIVKSSDDAILSKSLNGKITSWNDGAKLIYGYSADEVLGKDISILAPPERKDETKELIEKIKNGEHIHHYESVRIGKNGKRINVSLNLSPIFDISGNLTGISAISRDITLQKKARLALQRELTINQALSKIYSPLISPGKTISEISMIISNETLAITDSEHSFVATVDPKNHDLINHTLTRATPECRVYEEGEIPGEIIFHIGQDGLYPGLWGHCLNTKQAFYTNDAKNHHSAKGVPKGHIPIEKFLAVPILIDKELVGIIALANPYNKDYDDKDVDAVRRIADFFALAIQRKRYEDKISEALNEKEILLKEIHHRVKNNLMIISSLLNLQSRYLKDEESRSIFKESQNRAQSMALIHQRLYESVDLKNIGFKEYITTLANDLYRSYVKDPSRVNLKLEIEDVNVDINLAIPLGLILNELITNSLKYAFPAKEKGTVKVDFGKNEDTFYLKISDNGVGLPENIDWQNTDSLGLQLVNSLTSQIDGEVKLDKKDGTSFKIIFTEPKI